jgi:hypothetical protein
MNKNKAVALLALNPMFHEGYLSGGSSGYTDRLFDAVKDLLANMSAGGIISPSVKNRHLCIAVMRMLFNRINSYLKAGAKDYHQYDISEAGDSRLQAFVDAMEHCIQVNMRVVFKALTNCDWYIITTSFLTGFLEHYVSILEGAHPANFFEVISAIEGHNFDADMAQILQRNLGIMEQAACSGKTLHLKLLRSSKDEHMLQPLWSDQVEDITQGHILCVSHDEVVQRIQNNHIEVVTGHKSFGLFVMRKDSFKRLRERVAAHGAQANKEVADVIATPVSMAPQLPPHLNGTEVTAVTKQLQSYLVDHRLTGSRDHVVVVNVEHRWCNHRKDYSSLLKLNFAGGKQRYVAVGGDLAPEEPNETLAREIQEEWGVNGEATLRNFRHREVAIPRLRTTIYIGLIEPKL